MAAGSREEATTLAPHLLNRAWEHNAKVESAAGAARMHLKKMQARALSSAQRREEQIEQRISEEVKRRAELRDQHVHSGEQRIAQAEMQEAQFKLRTQMAGRRGKAAQQVTNVARTLSEMHQNQSSGTSIQYFELCKDDQVQDALKNLAAVESRSPQAFQSIEEAKTKVLKAFEGAEKRNLMSGARSAEEAFQQLKQADQHFEERALLQTKKIQQEVKENEENIEALAAQEARALESAARELESAQEIRSRTLQQRNQSELQKVRARLRAAVKKAEDSEHEATEAKGLIKAELDSSLLAMMKRRSATEQAAHAELSQIHAEEEQRLSALRDQLAAEGRAASHVREEVVAQETQQVQRNEDQIASFEEEEASAMEQRLVLRRREEIALQREFQIAEHACAEKEQESHACEEAIVKIRTDNLEAIRRLREAKRECYAEQAAVQQQAADAEEALQASLDKAIVDAREKTLASEQASSMRQAEAEERISAAQAHADAIQKEAEHAANSLMMEAQKKKDDISSMSWKIEQQAEESVESMRARRKVQLLQADQKAMHWSTQEAESVTSLRVWEQEEIEMYESRFDIAEDNAAARHESTHQETEQTAVGEEAAFEFVEQEERMQCHESQEVSEMIQAAEQSEAAIIRREQVEEEEATRYAEEAEPETRAFKEACALKRRVLIEACEEREQAAADSVSAAAAEARTDKEKEEQAVRDALFQKKAILESLEESGDTHYHEALSAMQASMQKDNDEVRRLRFEERERKELCRKLEAELAEFEQLQVHEEEVASANGRACEEYDEHFERIQEAVAAEELTCREEEAAKQQGAADALESLYTEEQEEVVAFETRMALDEKMLAGAEQRTRAASELETECLRDASEMLEDINQDRMDQAQVLHDRCDSAESAIGRFMERFRTEQRATTKYIRTIQALESVPLCDAAELPRPLQEDTGHRPNVAASAAPDLPSETADA